MRQSPIGIASADMAKLFLQDLANVEAAIYPLPADHDGSLLDLIRRSRLFFDDLPNIHRRRERRAHSEVLNETTRGTRPRYYLQNFHYQSGGWLTEKSAELYDTQVEVLFNGSANAIRRQALPPLYEVFAGRDQRKLKVIDIGCGTGRFIDAIKQVWPKLPVQRCKGRKLARSGRESGCTDQHFLIPRTAAKRASGSPSRMRPGIEARRTLRPCGLAPTR